jgi:hypothetical protein
MTRCGERERAFIDGSVFGDGSPAGIFWARHVATVRSWGFTRRPRAAVRTEPLPTAVSDALCLEQIVLVVVLVLAYDLCGRLPRN